jgi:hypothetical protein
VFVPENDLAKVSRAMFDAGAGVIGEYRECSFRVHGRGTFFGSEASNPAIGKAGQREEVEEWRLEVLCPGDALQAIISAMRGAHSYEEPAFDAYALESKPAAVGAARFGDLAAETTLHEFAQHVRMSLRAPFVQVVGTRQRPIRRVAVACGAAGEFLADAVAAGCHAFVTGEASFHKQLEAESSEIALIVAGHYSTERFAVEELVHKIATAFGDIEIWASQTERDPAWMGQ